MLRPTTAGTALLLLLLGGCVGEVTGPVQEQQVGHGSLSENGLSLNKLSLNKLSLNKLSLNKLSLNGLSDDGFAGLEQTEDGREVLTYVARCAVPEGQSLTASVDGVDYEFPGLLGIAPEWLNGACETSCQRWVSACLLAHANGLGVSVPISLRGPHPALTATAQEEQDYPVQEGAFYGNLFDPLFGVDYPMYICVGKATYAAVTNPESDLWKRLCGVWNECPIADAGSCWQGDELDGPACAQTLGDGTYKTCHPNDVNIVENTNPADVDTTDEPTEEDFFFDEVITVYLQK
jgi:hypothetical protein